MERAATERRGRFSIAARALALLALAGCAAAVLLIVTGPGSDSEPQGERGGNAARKGPGERERKGPQEEVYVVEPGDTFTGIAEKTGVPLRRLERLNPDVDPRILNAGQEIKLR